MTKILARIIDKNRWGGSTMWIARIQVRALVSTILALALFAPSQTEAVTFTWHPIWCPLWQTVNKDIYQAAKQTLEIAWGAHPATVVRCDPELPQSVIRQMCYGTFPPPMAQGTLFSTEVIGSGATPQDFNGTYYCAVKTWDSSDPEKGHGCSNHSCGAMKGDPVNIGNANNFQRETDFSSFDDGGLSFIRTYNSMPPYHENFMGSGWMHNWGRSIKLLYPNVQVFREDSKVFTFAPSGSLWVPDADVTDKLEQLSGGGWKFTTSDNEVELYDNFGRLSSVTSASGKVTTLVYSDGTSNPPNGELVDGTTTPLAPGNLIRVVDYKGRSIQLYYGSNQNISRVIDPAGKTYTYGYSSIGDLTTVQNPDGKTRTYVYDETVNTSGVAMQHVLTGIIDENGDRFATFKYYSSGQALSAEHAGGVYKYSFTYNTGSTTYVDPLGTSRTSPTTLMLGLMQVTGTTQTCAGCGGASTESYTFDVNRNISSRTDFNGNLTCYSYESRNLETQRIEGLSGTATCAAPVTTPVTRTITTNWHSTLRLPVQLAEPLQITTYTYNGDGGATCAPAGASAALLCSKSVQATLDPNGSQGFAATADGTPRIWSYTYNISGQLLTVDGPRTDVTDTTSYAYYSADDASGNFRAGDLASITNAKSQVTQFVQYDGAGRLLKTVNANGLETILQYSPRGWLTQRQVGIASAGYETTTYDYDAVGQLKKVTLPDSSSVSYTYDAAHRLTDIQDGLGNRIHYTLDAMGNRTQEDSYDPANNLARTHSRVIDALNRVVKEIGGTNPSTEIIQKGYDNNGNLTSIIDPLNRTTTQQYDALNRLIAVIDPFNGSSHPTTFQYNGRDALTQVTDPAGLSTSYSVDGQGDTTGQSSPDTGSTSFTYDAASNLKTKLDGRGIQAVYSHDELNRITQISYPDQTVTYAYDSCTNGVGRLCSISDRSGTTAYTYDLWGRVTSKTQTVDAVNQTISYSYNAAGQLSTLTLPSGHVVTYGYLNNQLVSTAVDGTTVLDSVVYEPFGPLAGWTWGNSAPGATNDFTRTIDKDYRVIGVASDLPVSGTQPLFDRQFSWDDQNRITSITDLANSALSASYGYDALDRLTSASQGSSTWGYAYNGTGDRVTSTDATGTANYAPYAGSHQLQSITGARSRSYTYDGSGNLSSDGTTTWTYGGDNRPIQIGSATMLMNAIGQRVKKVGASTTRFMYDEAGHLVGEYADDRSLLEETVWLGDLPVATLRPNGAGVDMYYVQTDQLGTPRMITRPSDNQIVWRWDNTEPFGNSSPNENPSGLGTFSYNPRFPGQYYDAETATNYNYFRDYDPSIGRYVESDPIGLAGGINTYGYADDNPVTKVDQLGLSSQAIDGGWRKPLGFPDVSAEARARLAQQLTHWLNKKSDLEECEEDCEEEKRARDALCFIAKAKGGKAAQKLCLSRSDEMARECREKCKKKFCEPKH